MTSGKYPLKANSILWAGLAILSRLWPHPANMTAFTPASVLLGKQASPWLSALIIISSLLIADIVLAYSGGYAIFGTWSLFTYSGFALISIVAAAIKPQRLIAVLVSTLASSGGFWLWTNFGTWLTTALYPHSWSGLMSCYQAALPFLRQSLLGDGCWLILLLALTQAQQLIAAGLVNDGRSLITHY